MDDQGPGTTSKTPLLCRGTSGCNSSPGFPFLGRRGDRRPKAVEKAPFGHRRRQQGSPREEILGYPRGKDGSVKSARLTGTRRGVGMRFPAASCEVLGSSRGGGAEEKEEGSRQVAPGQSQHPI